VDTLFILIRIEMKNIKIMYKSQEIGRWWCLN